MTATGITALFRFQIPPTWLYAGRTTLAAMLAIYVAFQLQLDTPYSAAVTAVIVANPMHGMVWSKSLYRLAGTLAGAIAALVLMGAFSQVPALFALGLGIWMGLCTATATLLRNFRSYGAVLAGYTVVLVAVPAVDDPLSIFDRVLNRGSVVVVGIICSALVSALFSPKVAERSLRAKLGEVLGDLGRYCALALGADEEGKRLAELRPRVGGGLYALNNLIEFAAAERPELARLSDSLGIAINGMLGAVSAATSVHTALRATLEAVDRASGLAEVIAEARLLVDRLIALPQRRDTATILAEAAALKDALTALHEKIEQQLPLAETGVMAALDRLDDMLAELALGIEGLMRLLRREVSDVGARPQYHLDWRGAITNGVRGALAVWAVCALWCYSAWPSGGAMILAIVPAVGLFATRDTPEQDSMGFAYGCLAASIAAVLYLTIVLPPFTSYFGLVCALAPPVFWAMLQTTNPRRVFFGVGFSVFFITQVAPSNPMVFDVPGTINSGVALVLGALLTAVVYRVILPANPLGRVRAMIRIIIGDLTALAQLNKPYPRAAWETRMHDRMMRMRAQLQSAGLPQETLMHGAFAAFRLGREILRARAALEVLPLSPAAARSAEGALEALEHVQTAPGRAAASCRDTATLLRGLAAENPRSSGAQFSRAAGSFLEMALLIDHHRRFFQEAAG